MSVKFKEIRFYPSHWMLDVYITKDHKKLAKIYKKRYAVKNPEFDSVYNFTDSIDSGTKGELKWQKRVILVLKKLDCNIIVHELVHVVWHIARYQKLKIEWECQEWQAYLTAYLFEEIMKDNYSKLS